MLLLSVFILGIFCVFLCFLKPRNRFILVKDKHILITGGSSGIGLALAKQARGLGANVTIVARDVHKLKDAVREISQLTSPSNSWVHYLPLDIAGSYDSVEEIINKYIDSTAPVNILINCAGYGIANEFLSTDMHAFESLVRLNYLASVNMTRVILPKMLKQNGPLNRVGFVSSMAGQVPLYGFSAYSPSKFAIKAFADVLRMELEATNVKITVVFPPDTQTPGYDKENESKPKITHLLSSAGGLATAEDVANQVMHDIIDGNYISCIGVVGKILAWGTAGISPPVSDSDSILGPFFGPLIECILATPLRLLAMTTSLYWRYIIRKEKLKSD